MISCRLNGPMSNSILLFLPSYTSAYPSTYLCSHCSSSRVISLSWPQSPYAPKQTPALSNWLTVWAAVRCFNSNVSSRREQILTTDSLATFILCSPSFFSYYSQERKIYVTGDENGSKCNIFPSSLLSRLDSLCLFFPSYALDENAAAFPPRQITISGEAGATEQGPKCNENKRRSFVSFSISLSCFFSPPFYAFSGLYLSFRAEGG